MYTRLLFVLFMLTLTFGQIRAQSINQSLCSEQVVWNCSTSTKKMSFIAQVPGDIYTDLQNNHLIENPFFGTNEQALRWVDSTDWIYETQFDLNSALLNKKHINLEFDGLDTYSDIYLNGEFLLSTNNMFIHWTCEAKQKLKVKSNQLKIVFHSTLLRAKELKATFEKDHGYVLPEGERVFVRKAQYHFGWDFAPRFLGCGIWKPVYLKAFDKPDRMNIPNQRIDKIELVQQKDSIGESFYFTLNQKPIFIKGANWVPADVFLTRMNRGRYRDLLKAAKEVGINMLRVWGGGIYESEDFYDLCDSLHIMVWQDFMFACAMYPIESTVDSIEQIDPMTGVTEWKTRPHFLSIELHQNIQRLLKHPCVVVFCGNNEIDEGWKNWGWQQQFHYRPTDSSEIWQQYKYLFQELIPDILKECGSDISYISTSPQIGWGHPESLTHGDSHYWGVWWGMEPYETYAKKVPRFASEYGMQSMPSLTTLESIAADSALYLQSAALRNHQKHPTGFANLEGYLKMYNLPYHTLTEYIAATQKLQSDALWVAINAHMKAQPRCMGTMLWQFNDCWPGASWSLIDYYGNKKQAYFTVQKLFTTN